MLKPGDDWFYDPRPDISVGAATSVNARRVLIVGPDPVDLADLGEAVVRRCAAERLRLPIGLYGMEDPDWDFLLIQAGRDGAEAETGSRRRWTGGHHVERAFDLFDNLWASAAPEGAKPAFAPGDLVKILGSGQVAVVTGATMRSGSFVYSIFNNGSTTTASESSLFDAGGSADDPTTWLRMAPADPAAIAETLTYLKLVNPLTDTVYSYGSSRTVFRSYQFRPLLKLLNSPHQRLLIADEVGLGKTIEAGLIWLDLEQRTEVRNVLVVCPSGLVHKWQDEMRRRFDKRLRPVRTRAEMREILADLREQRSNESQQIVVSLQLLRSPEILEDLAKLGPAFHLTVVDEAHHLRNRETQSNEVGRLLGDWSDTMIFLSATPLNLGSEDLFNLLQLLDEEEFADASIFDQQLAPNQFINDAAGLLARNRSHPQRALRRLRELETSPFGGPVVARPQYGLACQLLDREGALGADEVVEARQLLSELNTLSSILTRSRKVDVAETKAVRVAEQVPVHWSDREAAFYAAVLQWARQRALTNHGVVGFATIMPLRQVASCIPAMVAMLAEKHPEVSEADVIELDDDVSTDLADLDAFDLTLDEAQQHLASALVAVRGTPDSKFQAFAALLAQLRRSGMRQLMVFSFFKRTLAYLDQQLATDYRVGVMHGGVPMEERTVLMEHFRRGEIDILLLSEVGSEGLDFEFCNVMVNYDLPWNPMKVEQRIGRIDRFGQQHPKLFIYNFQVPGTIETDILERLYARIQVFEQSIGELEPIVRGELADLQKAILNPRLTESERRREVDRIEEAMERRRVELAELDAAQGQIAGLDGLLVDGFTRDTEERGRFIGGSEIEVLVKSLCKRTGASLRRPKGSELFDLVGTVELADLVARAGGNSAMKSLHQLDIDLRDSTPFPVTFDPDVASRTSAEFLTIRHPVVRAARLLIDDRLGAGETLSRFGSVAIPGPLDEPTLVLLSVAETTGLMPSLELWSTAVGVDTLLPVDPVGDRLLAALASGRLKSAEHDPSTDLARALDIALDLVEERRSRVELDRRATNSAIVSAREEAVRSSIDRRIAKDTELLAKHRGEGHAASIIRLYESKIANLRRKRVEKQDELANRRDTAVLFRHEAVIQVVPPAPKRTQ